MLHAFIDEGCIFVDIKGIAAIEQFIKNDAHRKDITFVGKMPCIITEHLRAAVRDCKTGMMTCINK